jgi:hypothetical protein
VAPRAKRKVIIAKGRFPLCQDMQLKRAGRSVMREKALN